MEAEDDMEAALVKTLKKAQVATVGDPALSGKDYKGAVVQKDKRGQNLWSTCKQFCI